MPLIFGKFAEVQSLGAQSIPLSGLVETQNRSGSAHVVTDQEQSAQEGQLAALVLSMSQF